MGGAKSKLVEAEKLNWPKPESGNIVNFNATEKGRSVKLIEELANKLSLCKIKSEFGSIKPFFHYYITDGTYVLEFTDETFTDSGISSKPVTLRQKEVYGEIEEKSFMKSEAVVKRLADVCGMIGYSLCFRNSEHVARYVATGTWTSTQMLPGSMAHELFKGELEKSKLQRLVNEKPRNFIKEDPLQTLYPGLTPFISWERSPQHIDTYDLDAFNVVFLGPTGCGKSNLVNQYFNQTVSISAGTAESVTQDVRFCIGTAQLAIAPTAENPEWHLEDRKVNIVDTIGLCDSALPQSALVALIKDKLKGNMTYIDRVVIVCSGRIELGHQDAIKQFMKWLQFEKYAANFTFIYNKADTLEEELRDQNLYQMCGLLGTGDRVLTCPDELFPSNLLGDQTPRQPGRQREMTLRLALGFPPQAPFEQVKDNLGSLLDSTMIPMKGPEEKYLRIPISESACAIL